MKATGREVIDVLEKAVELDWFRYARSELDNGTTPAPITVWRFKASDTADDYANRVIHALRSVLEEYSGNVLWTLRFTGQNWVLLPMRVRELEDSGQFRTDGEVLDYLYRENPGLGRKAHEDLAGIADKLAHQLQRVGCNST